MEKTNFITELFASPAVVAAIVAGIIAVITTIGNLWVVDRNTKAQLRAQALENDKKRETELYQERRKEAILKLEEAHNFLYQYIHETEQYLYNIFKVMSTSKSPREDFDNFVAQPTISYSPLRKNLTKAELLATAYAVSLDDEFAQLGKASEDIETYLQAASNRIFIRREQLSQIEFEQIKKDEKDCRTDARKAIKEMYDLAKKIDMKIIQQLKLPPQTTVRT
ncbi:hypothetical protein RRM58_003649 [Vibrio harveyi]|nr:hypothetical protein [Vibrio harveyi]